MQTGGILLVRMRKRGKYGLTIVFNTNKIGGFRPFSLVSTNLLTAATRCPGSTRAAAAMSCSIQQLFEDCSQRIQTPKTPEKHHPTQKGGGPLGISCPAGRAGNFCIFSLSQSSSLDMVSCSIRTELSTGIFQTPLANSS
jgi:hypothetical protein